MKLRFTLTSPERKPFTAHTDFTQLVLPLYGHDLVEGIKRRATVGQYDLLARHASPNIGDLHAPAHGVIKEVTTAHIILETTAPAEGSRASEAIELPSLEDLASAGNAPLSMFAEYDKVGLGSALKQMGVSLRPFVRPCRLFIINGLNPEPGMYYAEEMLAQYLPIVEAGFALAQRLSGAQEYVLAVPSGCKAAIAGAQSKQVKAEYPISLARPLITAITGKENTADVTMVRLHSLFALGLVALTGKPLVQSIISVQGKNLYVPLGAPVQELLHKAGTEPKAGDTVILGGAMRGHALANIALRGIGVDDSALLHIGKGSSPALQDNPCISCGLCVHVCPMRLRPNMLSRYAEFEKYSRCRNENIDLCIECGLCGYVCPACRPMQQHFRMAKQALGMHSLQQMVSR